MKNMEKVALAALVCGLSVTVQGMNSQDENNQQNNTPTQEITNNDAQQNNAQQRINHRRNRSVTGADDFDSVIGTSETSGDMSARLLAASILSDRASGAPWCGFSGSQDSAAQMPTELELAEVLVRLSLHDAGGPEIRDSSDGTATKNADAKEPTSADEAATKNADAEKTTSAGKAATKNADAEEPTVDIQQHTSSNDNIETGEKRGAFRGVRGQGHGGYPIQRTDGGTKGKNRFVGDIPRTTSEQGVAFPASPNKRKVTFDLCNGRDSLGEAEKLKSEMDELQKSLLDRKDQLKVSCQKSEKRQQEISKINEQIREQIRALKENEIKIESLQQGISRSGKEIKDTNALLDSMEKELEDTKGELQLKRQSSSDLAKARAALKRLPSDFEQDKQRLLSDYGDVSAEAYKKDLEETTAAYARWKKQYETQIAKLEASRDGAGTRSSEQRIQEIEAQRQQLLHHLEFLQQQKQRLEDELQSLQKNEKQNTANLLALRDDMQKLIDAQDKAQGENEKLLKQLDDIKNQINIAAQKQQKVHKELQDEKKRLKEEENITARRAEVAKLKEEELRKKAASEDAQRISLLRTLGDLQTQLNTVLSSPATVTNVQLLDAYTRIREFIGRLIGQGLLVPGWHHFLENVDGKSNDEILQRFRELSKGVADSKRELSNNSITKIHVDDATTSTGAADSMENFISDMMQQNEDLREQLPSLEENVSLEEVVELAKSLNSLIGNVLDRQPSSNLRYLQTRLQSFVDNPQPTVNGTPAAVFFFDASLVFEHTIASKLLGLPGF